MTIKPLNKDDSELITLSKEIGSLFIQSKWLSIFDNRLKLFGIFDKANKLIGAFSFYEAKYYGVKYIRNIPFDPSINLFYINRNKNFSNAVSFDKKIIAEIADFIDNFSASIKSLSFPIGIKDLQPFIWKKFKVIPHYTYHIDLGASLEDIYARMSPERRNDLKRAEKDNIIVRKCYDYQDVKSLVIKTYQRNKKKLDIRILDKILFQFSDNSNSYAFISEMNEIPIAAAFCVYDKTTAYYLLGGYDDKLKHAGAGPIAVWSAIQHAKRLDLNIFDFEGSMLPSIESYFRGFGGVLTPYYKVNKASILFEFLLKITNRHLF